MIRFTVITPVFNREDCIGRCIESVVGQNDPDVEYWIVNDGSTDKTGAIVEAYAKRYPCIKYHAFEKNKGVNAARNYAIQNSTGDFVIFLDSDDYFAENALDAIQGQISSHPGYSHYLFAQDDRLDYYNQNPLLKGDTAELHFPDFLTGKVTGDFVHVMAAPLLRAFPFNEYLRTYEDLTFLSIYKAGEKQYFTKQMVVKRERGRSDSVTKDNLLQNTDAIRKQHQALKERLSLFEADYQRFGAIAELQSLKRRINVLEKALKFGFVLKPAIFTYSYIKQLINKNTRL